MEHLNFKADVQTHTDTRDVEGKDIMRHVIKQKIMYVIAQKDKILLNITDASCACVLLKV